MARVSPLHKVIEAGRWDEERPLGRLFLVVHAAFLDAGFAPLPHPAGKRGPIPKEAGRTASALSLRYTAPELLRRRHAQASVVLRQQVYGRKIIFYVQRGDGRPVASSWVAVDALAAGALLSGGLDATALALRRDATLMALWRGLRDALCRRAHVDLCRGNGVALEPTFVSLPGDVVLAILARVAEGVDLVRVERTCATLRRLVAEHDRELWKPRYEAAVAQASSPFDSCGSTAALSWRERYERVNSTRLSLRLARLLSSNLDNMLNRSRRCGCCNPPADPDAERRRSRVAGGWRAAARIGRVPISRGQDQEEWRHGAGTPRRNAGDCGMWIRFFSVRTGRQPQFRA
ncbi:hypothetical protein EJB05_35163, partial [Eragrostis curvula]